MCICKNKYNQLFNDTSQDQIPYIAYPGDIIRFDTKNYAVYINGVPYKEDLAIGSTFFDLYKGDNQLITSPQEAFNTKVIYRDTHR
ncbi:phage distal tail protein [Roseburia sp. 1XD42-34]|uniref:phage distal tail protein n=1 Tax=Roseburia sp. 1XD42-34 TaxID=2305905 RepID=UPI001600C778